jgi:hypothetical protein
VTARPRAPGRESTVFLRLWTVSRYPRAALDVAESSLVIAVALGRAENNLMRRLGPPVERSRMTQKHHAGDLPPRDRRQRQGHQAAGRGSGAANGQRSRIQVGGPDGVLAVVPHLLGFYPSSSIVVLGIGGPRRQVRLAFRYDLPDPPDPCLSAEIAAHACAVLGRQRIAAAVVIGYGTGRLVTPVADILGQELRSADIALRDLLRVEDGRYWSYLCHDPQCCPAEGVPFEVRTHPAAIALRDAGLAVLPDRASLARTLAPLPGAIASMSAATDRALRRAEQLMAEAMSLPGGGDALRLVTDAGRQAVKAAIAVYRGGGEVTDHDQIAWLALALADLRVRDDAWARMDPEFSAAHRRLWADVVRHATARYLPAPAALLAFTAWQSGDGALAGVAIERALAADPGYSMALLLAEAIHAGLPPSAARLPLTPEEVAASYAAAGRRAEDAGKSPGIRASSRAEVARNPARPEAGR